MLYRNAMQGMNYGFSAMSLGIIELAARILIAMVSFRTNSYAVAVAGDAFAWAAAGISALIMYRVIWRRSAESAAPLPKQSV